MSAAPPVAWARRTGTVTVPAARFPGLSDAAYAATVEGNGMAPRFCNGDVLVIDPRRPPETGDCVVVWPEHEQERVELRRLDATLDAIHVVIGRIDPPG